MSQEEEEEEAEIIPSRAARGRDHFQSGRRVAPINPSCLLWTVKANAKDKNYRWISVRWKAKKLTLRNLHSSYALE